ncbi:MAG: inorganic phosphate transporter [Patescibacteria group bacterium]|jgi:PiT family inorganic phosphate transporter
MSSELLLLIMVVIVGLAYDFVNGFHDAANAIATSISSNCLSPRTAILLATCFNFIGALSHTAVAYTIGKGVVESNIVTQPILLAALLGAIAWNLITWRLGLPSSSTHALVGGLIGGALIATNFNWSVLLMPGITRIAIAMVLAPFAGLLLSMLVIAAIMWPLHWLKINHRPFNKRLKKLQILSAAWMSFSHGMNDAQNAMGIITIALMTYGAISEFHVPMSIRILCAFSMGAGTMFGGWRIIRTIVNQLSGKETLPVQGFAAQTSAGGVILISSLLGLPISTSHAISSSVIGTTAASRIGAANWRVGGQMVVAWIITVPAAMLFAAIFELLITYGQNALS